MKFCVTARGVCLSLVVTSARCCHVTELGGLWNLGCEVPTAPVWQFVQAPGIWRHELR